MPSPNLITIIQDLQTIKQNLLTEHDTFPQHRYPTKSQIERQHVEKLITHIEIRLDTLYSILDRQIMLEVKLNMHNTLT